MTAARLYAFGLSAGLMASLVGVSCEAPTAPHADFDLAGRHAEVTCATCHAPVDAPFEELRGATCTQCHLATIEDRLAANPQLDHPWLDNCEGCHTAGINWEQTGFGNHTFPRQHGNADGECNACHGEPATSTNWSCLTCHPNERNEHDDVPGFRNEDSACIECHPDGQE
ncbi:MAG: hypothetical protein KC912_09105 [Proteobacteria bacterium]|nr:hypothetical protein [Pseudomonadota bacterium]